MRENFKISQQINVFFTSATKNQNSIWICSFHLKINWNLFKRMTCLALFFPGGKGRSPQAPQGFQKNFKGNYTEKIFCAQSECFDMFLVPGDFACLVRSHSNHEKYPFHMSIATPKNFPSFYFENVLPLFQNYSFCVYKLR